MMETLLALYSPKTILRYLEPHGSDGVNITASRESIN